MPKGNFANGDYFIDCGGASQSVLRAIIGVWLNFAVAVFAFCVRSIFRSLLKRKLLANKARDGQISLWSISPATTSSEVFELRVILLRALARGDYPYLLASLVCVAAAIVGAASTTIANHTVVSNVATRRATVPGRLVTREHSALSGALVNITSRVYALDQADAPLTEMFDFTPADSSGWVFVPSEWNNTWKGTCSYFNHSAVDLVVYPTNSTSFRDVSPLLGNVLPQWTLADPAKQAADYAGFYDNANANGTGSWTDLLVTHQFGTVPDLTGDKNATNVQVCFANYLAHGIARGNDTYFLQTAFKSDVHVVDCTFENATPGAEDQARVNGGQYLNSLANVANVSPVDSIGLVKHC